MRLNHLIAAAIAIPFAGSVSVQAAGSQSGHWSQSGLLLRQMDTDRNGTVSKQEFLQFMSRTFTRNGRTVSFNRLDINRNGKLERNELRPLIAGRWN